MTENNVTRAEEHGRSRSRNRGRSRSQSQSRSRSRSRDSGQSSQSRLRSRSRSEDVRERMPRKLLVGQRMIKDPYKRRTRQMQERQRQRREYDKTLDIEDMDQWELRNLIIQQNDTIKEYERLNGKKKQEIKELKLDRKMKQEWADYLENKMDCKLKIIGKLTQGIMDQNASDLIEGLAMKIMKECE